jgi:hypothetical protein
MFKANAGKRQVRNNKVCEQVATQMPVQCASQSAQVSTLSIAAPSAPTAK